MVTYAHIHVHGNVQAWPTCVRFGCLTAAYWQDKYSSSRNLQKSDHSLNPGLKGSNSEGFANASIGPWCLPGWCNGPSITALTGSLLHCSGNLLPVVYTNKSLQVTFNWPLHSNQWAIHAEGASVLLPASSQQAFLLLIHATLQQIHW